MVRPNKAYFLVKVSREEQKLRREKQGILYLVSEDTDMRRNKQCGEIVAIGEKAQSIFPEAKVGHTLIFHHFVEGDKATSEECLVGQDAVFNYYVVSSYAQNGKATESYGVWDGEKIIPHPDFIFLEPEAAAVSAEKEDFLNQAMEVTASGLFIFKEYVEEREDLTDKAARLKREAETLAQTGMTDEVKVAIQEKEKEQLVINRQINKMTFKPYPVAYFHPAIQDKEWFNRKITVGEPFFCQTNAPVEVEFMDKIYRICETKYIGFILN